MGVCGNVCCVAAVVKNSVFFFSFGVLKYVLCVCVGYVMDVVFSVCIVNIQQNDMIIADGSSVDYMFF